VIDMKKSLLFLLPLFFMLGCSTEGAQPSTTYELLIGDRSVSLPVHEDMALVQADLLSNLKHVWDSLDSGESEIFRYKRGATLSPKYRFFKHRNGKSGLEQLPSRQENKSRILLSAENPSWKNIGGRISVNSAIDVVIMGKKPSPPSALSGTS
jgi:hypothetical protein